MVGLAQVARRPAVAHVCDHRAIGPLRRENLHQADQRADHARREQRHAQRLERRPRVARAHHRRARDDGEHRRRDRADRRQRQRPRLRGPQRRRRSRQRQQRERRQQRDQAAAPRPGERHARHGCEHQQPRTPADERRGLVEERRRRRQVVRDQRRQRDGDAGEDERGWRRAREASSGRARVGMRAIVGESSTPRDACPGDLTSGHRECANPVSAPALKQRRHPRYRAARHAATATRPNPRALPCTCASLLSLHSKPESLSSFFGLAVQARDLRVAEQHRHGRETLGDFAHPLQVAPAVQSGPGSMIIVRCISRGASRSDTSGDRRGGDLVDADARVNEAELAERLLDAHVFDADPRSASRASPTSGKHPGSARAARRVRGSFGRRPRANPSSAPRAAGSRDSCAGTRPSHAAARPRRRAAASSGPGRCSAAAWRTNHTGEQGAQQQAERHADPQARGRARGCGCRRTSVLRSGARAPSPVAPDRSGSIRSRTTATGARASISTGQISMRAGSTSIDLRAQRCVAAGHRPGAPSTARRRANTSTPASTASPGNRSPALRRNANQPIATTATNSQPVRDCVISMPNANQAMASAATQPRMRRNLVRPVSVAATRHAKQGRQVVRLREVRERPRAGYEVGDDTGCHAGAAIATTPCRSRQSPATMKTAPQASRAVRAAARDP